MQIERIHEADLTPSDDSLIAAMLGASFDTDFGGRSYYQQRHHMRIVCRHDGAIVGHIALALRDIRLGTDLVPVLGIAEVATAPSARGQGVASALLKDAIEFAEGSIAQFLILFGDKSLYAGHGFENTHNPIRFVDMKDARTNTVKDGVGGALMVLPTGDMTWDVNAPVDFLGHLF